MPSRIAVVVALLVSVCPGAARAQPYTNFESSHVHPIALTPSGQRLLVVNTPDAVLEVFIVDASGALTHEVSIPVGLEPVTVAARGDGEAWVVNHLSDSISIVDLALQETVQTLEVGDEPNDVVFAGGRAFVAVSQEDAVKIYDLADLGAAPQVLDLPGVDIRALAVTPNQQTIFAIPMHSGNKTTVVQANVAATNTSGLNGSRLVALGLNDMVCDGAPPPHPPLPPGMTRNPALTDPADGVPKVAVIVKFNDATGRWEDETGQDWTHCLPLRLTDLDLFEIDTASLQVTTRSNFFSLGTTLFDVSVKPDDGRVFVPHTDARNVVRFDHPLGLGTHTVDNRLAAVGIGDGSKELIDLNAHIDRQSDPATNLVERQASISQPGMMVWESDGSAGYLTAIGSRKVFRVDGGCTTGSCIFGANRATPDAVVVGEGPTGVALLESAARLYVLNRFSNSVAVVDTMSLMKVDEIGLNDPSATSVKEGRRLFYDGIDTSGHGDSACATCHPFGDTDMLVWDLGDPEGPFAPYSTPFDNVRFVSSVGGDVPPEPCDPVDPLCASKLGIDPQKGPMFTLTFRGMMDPLHWRGDKPTMRDFNSVFVTLLGAEDIGPINGQAAGLNATDIEAFRDFTMGIRFPPNPNRSIDDSIPDATRAFPKLGITGNPALGETLFRDRTVFGPATCSSCHAQPFGAAGGVLGGVEPAEPTSLDTTAFMRGTLAEFDVLHFDLEVPPMRNLYEKLGPTFGTVQGIPPESLSGFGFTHDGAIPSLLVLLSTDRFNLTVQEARDIAAFLLHFPTGTRPAVGQTVLLPPGAPPTGPQVDEDTLATLIALGDGADANRHCDLVVATRHAGRQRRFQLAGGVWATDRIAEAPIPTATLRENAEGSVSFLCSPIGSGPRLGGDRDIDDVRDGDDNCPMHNNPLQSDSNNDGLGDVCDPTAPPTTTSTSTSTSTSTTSTTINAPPFVTITSPNAGGPTFVRSEPVTFSGTAVDNEQGDLTAQLVWTSSIDGSIGTGGSFMTTALSVGNHTITAAATDALGAVGSRTVVATVAAAGPPQQATFTSIAAEDGHILESDETSNAGGILAAGLTDFSVGDTFQDRQVRGILSFDTSSLPDGVVITSAVLSVTRIGATLGANPFDSLSPLGIDLRTGAFGGNTALEVGDFQAAATVTNVGTLGNAPSSGAVSTGSLDAAGRAAINRAGRTQVRLAFALDDNDNAVTNIMRYASGENTNAAQRPQLVVTFVEAPPEVAIAQPADGAALLSGLPVTFTGSALDPEEGNLTVNLTWTSNRDGVIGTGGTFTTSALSIGLHTVTASVTDSTGLTGSRIITLQLNPASPASVVTFVSIGVEDGNIAESNETSNVGGGVAAANTELRVGDHPLDLQFKGFVSFDTSAIPDAAVLTNATLRLRRQVLRGSNPFEILGSCLVDVQSGSFSGNPALESVDFQAPATAVAAGTMSNPLVDGEFSTGALDATGLAAIGKTGRTQMRLAFQIDDDDDLSQDHILFSSGDSADPARRPQLVVTFFTAAPLVTILAPADEGSFIAGSAVTFAGTATDAEDGDLTANLVWTSNLDGTIGNGGSFATSTLSVGSHLITAQVADSSANVGQATVHVTIITATTVTTTSTSTTTNSSTSTSTTAPPPTTTSTSTSTSSTTSTTAPPPTTTSTSTSTSSTTSTTAPPPTTTSTTAPPPTTTSTTAPPPTTTSTSTSTSSTTSTTAPPPTTTSTTAPPPTTTSTTAPPPTTTSTTAPPPTTTSTSTSTSTSSTTSTTAPPPTTTSTTAPPPTTTSTSTSTSSTTSTTAPPPTTTSTTAPPPTTTSTTAPPPTTTSTSTSTSSTTSTTAPPPTTTSTTAPPPTTTSTSTSTSSTTSTTAPPPTTTSTTAPPPTTTSTSTSTSSTTSTTAPPPTTTSTTAPPPTTTSTTAPPPTTTSTSTSTSSTTSTTAPPPTTTSTTAPPPTTTSTSTSTSSTTSTTAPPPTTTSTSTSTSSTTSTTAPPPTTTSTSTSSTTSTTAPPTTTSTTVLPPSTTTTSTSTTSTTTLSPPVDLTFVSVAAEDGHVAESSETSGVGGIVSSTSAEVHVGDQFNDAQFKGIVSFDTSAIPDGALITGATLRLRRVAVFGVNPFTTHGSCQVEIVSGAFGGDPALQASDFQAVGSATAVGTLSNPATNGSLSTATLSAAGLAAISKTGRTQFRLAFDLDDDDDSFADRVRFGSGDNVTATNRPELVVTFVE